MRALLVFIGKDLRLLWRDRAGLLFLLAAPLIVIAVAGFSLANLYGADPTGQTAYDLPLVDEDGGALGRQIRDRLARDPAVRVSAVPSREAAQQLVRRKQAGTALVIPAGTDAALDAGRSVHLILYDDPVKYLELLNVRIRLLALADTLAAERAASAASEAAAERQQVAAAIARLKTTVAADRARLAAAWNDARRTRVQLIEATRRAAGQARAAARRNISDALQRESARLRAQLERQAEALRAAVRAYGESVARARAEFERWLGELKRLAGSHAADIPPPPQFPELPPELQAILDGRRAPIQLPTASALAVELPEPRLPEVPPLPALPAIEIPDITLPAAPSAPAALTLEEVNLSGGPSHVNTFDQNVPGFAVTFLLLGMLLGISLGLLDEREWGTLERLRALPVGRSQFMLAKLLSRFLVGVAQMILLLAVGWLAFGVSLGPQPAALLLPTAGIAFAGTACGLLVAALARSRESVFSVGSVVMVTMAAVGGCWWPIDLEPRWMRTAARALPTTWAMDAFNDLMIRRRGPDAALVPTAVMLAFGATYLAVGLWIFRRRRRP